MINIMIMMMMMQIMMMIIIIMTTMIAVIFQVSIREKVNLQKWRHISLYSHALVRSRYVRVNLTPPVLSYEVT